jgi:hypothetical protein
VVVSVVEEDSVETELMAKDAVLVVDVVEEGTEATGEDVDVVTVVPQEVAEARRKRAHGFPLLNLAAW